MGVSHDQGTCWSTGVGSAHVTEQTRIDSWAALNGQHHMSAEGM